MHIKVRMTNNKTRIRSFAYVSSSNLKECIHQMIIIMHANSNDEFYVTGYSWQSTDKWIGLHLEFTIPFNILLA